MPKSGPKSNIDPAAVLEAAAESILVTTTDLDAPGPSILYANPAFERMTGWSAAEVLGKSPRILQGPKTDLRVFADLRETLHAGKTWENRTVNYRKDGSEFWMEWSIVPLLDERGEVRQYVAIQRDVSARVEAEHHLQEAQAAERAAERARTNLARYFSPKLVQTLAAKDHPLGPVRRQNLAVLFADVVDFTRLSETLDPEQVMEILRDIHSWMEKAIFQRDGSIEGYIGDAVLAIFGFPETGGDDAGNALSCAYELLTAARHWNQERAERDLVPINIRLGLHYGPVVLGDVGTEEYVEFTVIGDTVNTASRLQQAARTLDCDLIVSQELVTAIKGEDGRENMDSLLGPLRRYGNFAIRGRSQAVEVWTFSMAPRQPERRAEMSRIGDTVVVNDRMQRDYRYTIVAPTGADFPPSFRPHFTPAEMLAMGVFEGKYCNDCRDEFPDDWFAEARIGAQANPALNYFGIKSRQPLAYWREKGWIIGPDPRGWFQWYCRYYLGRRLPEIDAVQVKRWRGFARHAGQIRANCEPGDIFCRRRQRQALLQWSHDPFL